MLQEELSGSQAVDSPEGSVQPEAAEEFSEDVVRSGVEAGASEDGVVDGPQPYTDEELSKLDIYSIDFNRINEGNSSKFQQQYAKAIGKLVQKNSEKTNSYEDVIRSLSDELKNLKNQKQFDSEKLDRFFELMSKNEETRLTKSQQEEWEREEADMTETEKRLYRELRSLKSELSSKSKGSPQIDDEIKSKLNEIESWRQQQERQRSVDRIIADRNKAMQDLSLPENIVNDEQFLTDINSGINWLWQREVERYGQVRTSSYDAAKQVVESKLAFMKKFGFDPSIMNNGKSVQSNGNAVEQKLNLPPKQKVTGTAPKNERKRTMKDNINDLFRSLGG